jgi:hypothetical protein
MDLEACHTVLHNQAVVHQPLPAHLNLSRNEKSKLKNHSLQDSHRVQEELALEEHPGMAMESEHLEMAMESEHPGMAMELEHLVTAMDLEACRTVFRNQAVVHQSLPVHSNLSRNEKSKH